MEVHKKIKILSVFGDTVMANRGTPIRIKNLLYQLSLDKEIDLFTFNRDKNLSINTKHFSCSNILIKDIKDILKIIRENDIDIVIGHTINSYKLLLLVKLFTRSKIVLEMHGFIEEEDRLNQNISNLKYIFNKFVYSLFYKTCDFISTCSDSATEKICQYNKKTFTVFGGVDISLFYPRETLLHERIVIGYAGSVRTWQGLDFLVATFISRNMDEKGYELRLLLSQHYALPEEAKSITVLNPVPPEEVPVFLSQCDVLVIPRENNEVNRLSFPSKLIEYMAMGIPVVASKTSDMHKIITHTKNGMLFEPGNAEDMYSCITKLGGHKELRQSIGKEASLYVSNQYTWEK